jgi:TetR/AcrR family transcriptional repressor of bet genes
MGRKPISEIRRQELIEAAYQLLITEGLPSLTVERVARQAGVSKGIIHHYFRDKKQLIEGALVHLSTFPGGVTFGRLKSAHTPAERIWAIVASNLRAEVFQPSVCRAWLALCADASVYPEAKKSVKQYYTIMEKEFLAAFGTMLEKDEAAVVSADLVALLDGLWLRNAIRASSVGTVWATELVRDYLRHRVPKFDLTVANE